MHRLALRGVDYTGEWQVPDSGICQHVRRSALALAATGTQVALRGPRREVVIDKKLIAPDVWKEVGHLAQTEVFDRVASIRHIILHNAAFLKKAMMGPHEYRQTIIYTSWERTTVAPEVVELLNLCGEVWLPCAANAKAFRDAGVERPVRVMPPPYDPDSGVSKIPNADSTVQEGKRFYHVGKWEPRKNQHGLIGAFLLAFRPQDRASLFLKTGAFGEWTGYPMPADSLEHWLAQPEVSENGWTPEHARRLIRVVAHRIDESELVAIHRMNNIYVSPSHGEAWELGAFDARAAGNRLVYVPWSGASEYAAADDVPVFDLESEQHFVPVHHEYKWEPDAMWTDVPVLALRDALRRAEPRHSREHPSDFPERFGIASVGQLMRDGVECVGRKLSVSP